MSRKAAAKSARKALQLFFGVLLPLVALSPAFRSLGQVAISGVRYATVKGVAGGWVVAVALIGAWQALSMLAVVILVGRDALDALYPLRLTAILSLLVGFFIGCAALIVVVAYGQCRVVLQDLSGMDSRFYLITLLGLTSAMTVGFERLWVILHAPLKPAGRR